MVPTSQPKIKPAKEVAIHKMIGTLKSKMVWSLISFSTFSETGVGVGAETRRSNDSADFFEGDGEDGDSILVTSLTSFSESELDILWQMKTITKTRERG